MLVELMPVIAVGMLVGLVLGLTGAGGSILALPLLLTGFQLPVPQAIGLSLSVVSCSALVGVAIHWRSGLIQWLPAWVYALVGMLFAPLGTLANRLLPASSLLALFALLMLLIAARMWRQASQAPADTRVVRADRSNAGDNTRAACRVTGLPRFQVGWRCVLAMTAGAAVTGFLSGLVGVGGGFLIVPALLWLTGMSLRQAVATSLVIVTIISASGFASFLVIDPGEGDEQAIRLLPGIVIGGAMGMSMGTLIGRYIAGPVLQKLFACIVALMAFWMMFLI